MPTHTWLDVMNPSEIENEVSELSIVEESHVNKRGTIYVGFNVKQIPESFNSEMLSDGYAISKTIDPVGIESGATYKNITEF